MCCQVLRPCRWLCAWKCFISSLGNDVSSAPSLTFSGYHSHTTAAIKKHTEDYSFTPGFHRIEKWLIIVCPLRWWEGRSNVFCVSGQPFLSSCCLLLSFDHSNPSCFTAVVIPQCQSWALNPPTRFWIRPPRNPPSDQQLLLCLDQQFRHTFHNH